MRRKTMVLAGLHWFILVFCHIVLCSHSLRHHHLHSSSPAAAGYMGGLPSSSSSLSSPSMSTNNANANADGGNVDTPAEEQPGQILEDDLDSGSSMLMDSPLSSLRNGDDEDSDSNRRLMADSPKASPVIPYTQVKIKPGHELKLKCDLNNTYGRIMWLLNGNLIRTDNGRYSIESKNKKIEGRLTINNVLHEDDGTWICHHQTFDGKEQLSKPIRVIVMAAPATVHLEFDGRRVSPSTSMSGSSPSARVTYREKNNISIECIVQGGNPAPRIMWFLDSRNLTNSSQVMSDFLDDDKIYITRSTLRIENVSRSEHNKSVLCVVEHELLVTPSNEPSYLRTMAQFNIEYPPSFVLSRIPGFGYPIREGISMALKCEIDANPLSRPIWLKDKGEPPVPQTDDGYLNFTTVNRNNTGWYQCISHHPMGKFSSVGYYLTVRYEPTIVHQPPTRIEASLGDRIHMKCGADGSPSPALCWSRIGYGGTLTTVGSGQELILDKILYQEAGSYRCVAQNRVGLEERRALSHDVSVVVSGRPIVYPSNRTIMGFTGQPLSLSVELCANPIPEKSFWIFGTTALRPGARHRNKYVAQQLTRNDKSGDCYLAVLTILNVSDDDAMEYMFFAKNRNGMHEGTILLNITQASYSISISSSRAYSPFFSTMSTLSASVVCGLSFWVGRSWMPWLLL